MRSSWIVASRAILAVEVGDVKNSHGRRLNFPCYYRMLHWPGAEVAVEDSLELVSQGAFGRAIVVYYNWKDIHYVGVTMMFFVIFVNVVFKRGILPNAFHQLS